jgi:uncharacterized membrane protein SpoIIM required for sporulation
VLVGSIGFFSLSIAELYYYSSLTKELDEELAQVSNNKVTEEHVQKMFTYNIIMAVISMIFIIWAIVNIYRSQFDV